MYQQNKQKLTLTTMKTPINTTFGIVLVKFTTNNEAIMPSEEMIRLVKSDLDFCKSLKGSVKMKGVLTQGFRLPISWKII